MKKLLIILSLLTLSVNAQAQTVKNYWWEGNKYDAHSTNYISETITPLGDGLIQFDLITQGCTRGTGGGGHADDCDAPWGTVYRSQLTSKIPSPMDKPLQYSFQFKDISENEGLGFDGPGITIFELYPAWFSTRNNGPTHHIWYDPKSKAIETDVNKKWLGQISLMSSGWNTFVIQTNQTTKANGYMRIIHNGKIIEDYKGPTTYNAKKGIEFWIGAYVCCSFTRKGEPNHAFLFKNVKASIGLGGYDDKLKINSAGEATKDDEILEVTEVSNAFDGSYWFEIKVFKTSTMSTFTTIGYGSLVINQGIVTINKGVNVGEKLKYNNFEGRIDKNGNIVANFHFSPCSHCNYKDKTVLFTGNIDKLELSGLYDTYGTGVGLKVIFDMK